MPKERNTSRAIAKLIAGFAADKKAEEIVILDMRKLANFCDYFVICSATSDRRLGAIADGIHEELGKLGIKLRTGVKNRESGWVLLDAGDVVVHIFSYDLREFYGLEYLWQDAPRVKRKK